MEETLITTDIERKKINELKEQLFNLLGDTFSEEDKGVISKLLTERIESGELKRNVFELNPVLMGLQTAILAVQEEGMGRDGVLAIILYCMDCHTHINDNVERIIHGLHRIQELYKKNPVIESENFRNLLLSFAEDMRVILIMIADRVNLMREIRDTLNKEAQQRVSEEASYLYAPLAHKLGLYKLKSELEDLSLKYLEHDAYYMIRSKLNETKKSRDEYIEKFIKPVEQRLKEAGLHFHMKGRTKSIHSIWQKMKKQQCGFEGIYDLFAIRIIIETEKNDNNSTEHALCWQAYSIVTDMYQPNPKRLRDWLSVPKSNGYESLHITVLGPEQKWVEVQIRTERMDEVAERGLAAHWRYKGVKSESSIDEWLGSIRSALEAGDGIQMMNDFRMDLYEDEVYVFTPKGDLKKFPRGATVLDFAYHIHSNVGNKCTGARINGKVVSFRHTLQSGDQVEIMTANNQTPKQDWLNIVKTSRAKSKIRLALKETQVKDGIFAKEMLERRMKNRKIELEEAVMNILIKKLGFKEARDFYKQLAEGVLDPNTVIERYQQLQDESKSSANDQRHETRSAEEFVLQDSQEELLSYSNDDNDKWVERDFQNVIFFSTRKMEWEGYFTVFCHTTSYRK